jgi:hypothetical protein
MSRQGRDFFHQPQTQAERENRDDAGGLFPAHRTTFSRMYRMAMLKQGYGLEAADVFTLVVIYASIFF